MLTCLLALMPLQVESPDYSSDLTALALAMLVKNSLYI